MLKTLSIAQLNIETGIDTDCWDRGRSEGNIYTIIFLTGTMDLISLPVSIPDFKV